MSKAQNITYIRNNESIRLNDESVLEEVLRAGKDLSNEDLLDIIWGNEAVTPKEARRRYQPIYRATHNLVETGALLEMDDAFNSDTNGTETQYRFVPEGKRIPVPSKKGYKAKYEATLEEVERLKAQIAADVVPICADCTRLLCHKCTDARQFAALSVKAAA